MSETATVITPTETVQPPSVGLKDLSPTQYDNWRKTGDLPSSEPENLADPLKDTTAAEIPTAENNQQGSEPQKADAIQKAKPKPRDDANARIGQLTERAKAAEKERDELRAKLAAGSTSQPAPAAGSAEPVAAQPKPPTHIELVKKYQANPDWPGDTEAFVDFPDPYAAMLAAQAAYIGEKQWADREHARSQQTERERVQAIVDKTWADMKAQFPETDTSALNDLSGQSVGIVSQLIFESPSSVQLLNYFSNNPAEARSVAAMEPLAAAKAIGKLESSLSTPAPSRIAAPTKTVSTAPEPIQTLGTRHTPNAGDEVEQAIRDKDTGRYIELANKRELAEMKAGRR